MGKFIFYIFLLLSLTILAGSAYINHILTAEVVDGKRDMEFKIAKGSSREEIVKILQINDLPVSLLHFKITVKWLKVGNKIRYGRFKLPKGKTMSMQELVLFMTDKGVQDKNLTVPEGYNIKQIATEVQDIFGIEAADFVMACKNPELLKKYNINAESFEGYLYPETYNFDEESSPEKIIETMHKMFLKKIQSNLQDIHNSGYTLHEVMTLASIVQGEVRVASEAENISALYQNRLKKKMLLQADPTIQYLLDEPRRLYKKDLEIDNRYNTYKYTGLPPGPINNPSIEIVKAVLHPAKVNFVYMVAKGNGEHYFNETWDEHLADKSKFDRVRKKVAREKAKQN